MVCLLLLLLRMRMLWYVDHYLEGAEGILRSFASHTSCVNMAASKSEKSLQDLTDS